MTDDALMCFVDWCRTNNHPIVHDPKIVRSVFNAYTGIGTQPEQSWMVVDREQMSDEWLMAFDEEILLAVHTYMNREKAAEIGNSLSVLRLISSTFQLVERRLKR